MKLYEIILAIAVCAPGLFFTIGSYILQRDRYWARVWKKLEEPQVQNIAELKLLMEGHHRTMKRGASQSETTPVSVV